MDEVRHLRELLAACHRFLQAEVSKDDEIADAIRETCALSRNGWPT